MTQERQRKLSHLLSAKSLFQSSPVSRDWRATYNCRFSAATFAQGPSPMRPNLKVTADPGLSLLPLPKIRELQSSKSRLQNWVFTAFNHILTITSNKPWKTKKGSKSTNHKPWPFEPVKLKFCFLRGPLRWLTAAKNANVNWLLNLRICVFLKSVVNSSRWVSRCQTWYWQLTRVLLDPAHNLQCFLVPLDQINLRSQELTLELTLS